jgi:hypothetical protein
MKNFSPFRASLIAFCLALSACGGGGGGGSGGGTTPIGGGDGSDTEIPPSGTYGGAVDFQAAMTELMQVGVRTYMEAFRKDLDTGARETLSILWVRRHTSESFQGVVHQRTDQDLRLTDSAGGFGSITTGWYFDTAPLSIHGFIASDATVSVANPTGVLPTAGRVGESGPYFTYVTYKDSSQAVVESRGTTTWAIKASTPTAVFACLETVDQEPGQEKTQASECYELDSATGRFNGNLRVTYKDGSQTTVFNKDRPS